MAYLIVGGVDIPVSWPDGAESSVEEFGDMDRAFAGNMLSSIRDRRRSWEIQTRCLTYTEYGVIRAVLTGTPPITCSGDLITGTTTCVVVLHSETVETVAAGRRYVFRFDLHQI